MRTKIKTLLFFLFALAIGYGQSNCSKFYPMTEGATFQYTTLNKKGKSTGVADYKVTEVNTDGDATEATMSIVMRDAKDKEIYNTSYSFTCEDNKVTIDYESLLPESMMAQFEDMEVEISGTDIEIPNNLTVGEELADANVSISMNVAGMNMKTVVNMLNRKVEKKEKVTTSAGSFDCFVIYSENQTKAMGMNKTFPSRMWLAEDKGMIVQETYKKNGDLMSRTELTAYSD